MRIAFLCLALSVTVAQAQLGKPDAAIQSMVEAERSFYQTGQIKGTRAAFLSFLAEDSVVFRPGPINGREVWEKRVENGLDLIWEPTFATIARSGDFGFTTGPAKWKANKEETKFLGYGRFLSIWKRQEDGGWKVALDVGIETPVPSGPDETLRLLLPEEISPGAEAARARRESLQAAQDKFRAAARLDFTAAFLNTASDEVRVYRDGAAPAFGKGATARVFGPKRSRLSIEPSGRGISESSDLAYSYGSYSLDRDGTIEKGFYFQLWRAAKKGWELLADLEKAEQPK